MREIFAVANGFDNRNGEEVDNDMTSFFSLEEIERLSGSGASLHQLNLILSLLIGAFLLMFMLFVC